MTRRSFLVAPMTALPCVAASYCEITIAVGKGNSVTITVPNIRKADLINILASFLGNGPNSTNSDATVAAAKLTKVLQGAGEIRLVMASDCPAQESQ